MSSPLAMLISLCFKRSSELTDAPFAVRVVTFIFEKSHLPFSSILLVEILVNTGTTRRFANAYIWNVWLKEVIVNTCVPVLLATKVQLIIIPIYCPYIFGFSITPVPLSTAVNVWFLIVSAFASQATEKKLVLYFAPNVRFVSVTVRLVELNMNLSASATPAPDIFCVGEPGGCVLATPPIEKLVPDKAWLWNTTPLTVVAILPSPKFTATV